MMKLLLVNPCPLDEDGRRLPPAREISYGLTLPYLAALIGGRHEIRIIDDNFEPCDPATPADAVLFTAMSSRVERAYQLAAGFRERGVRTVLGGIHASALPEDAQPHVDAVCVGEAETIIPDLIADLEADRLQPRYTGRATDLVGLPTPYYQMMNPAHYLFRMDPVQVVRGCPNRCRYCTVSDLYGASYRYRPTADVLRDLDRASTFLYFIDDNLMADRDRALELFRAMKGRGKLFFAQGTLALAADPELLAAARAAGLMLFYTGIETLNQKGHEMMGRKGKLGLDPGECLDILRKSGISVMASMMVGFEGDSEASMEEMVRFLEKHKVHFLLLYILTPPPGTRWYRQMEKEGKIPPTRWGVYDGVHAVVPPRGMSNAEITRIFDRTFARFYSVRSAARRLLWPPRLTPMVVNLMMGSNLRRGLTPFLGVPATSRFGRLGPLAQALLESRPARAVVRMQSD